MRAAAERASGVALFRCPECSGALEDLVCAACGQTYRRPDGIPDLLGSGPLARRYRSVAAYYDDLYAARRDVWREQGHTDAFTRYLAELVEAGGPGRYLDVGCGEGLLLAEAGSMQGFGIDLSRRALLSARARSGATLAVAAAERLPFSDRTFEVVTSVGAMEHFLDDAAATAEIRRILRPGGRYVLALLVDVTLLSRVGIKARAFLWPRPRPLAFGRWLVRKALASAPAGPAPAFPQQPVQNRYRPAGVRALFRLSGFRVARVLTKARCPEVPLPGHHMRLYSLEAV